MKRILSFALSAPLIFAAPVFAQDDAPPSEESAPENDAPADEAPEAEPEPEPEAQAEPEPEPEPEAEADEGDGEQAKKEKGAPKEEEKKPEPPPPPQLSEAELSELVWKVITTGGTKIDACTAKYLDEFPKTDGKMKVDFKVEVTEKPDPVDVSTELPSSDKMMKCTRDAVKSWTFPKEAKFTLQFEVIVRKGAKFKLLKAGEEPPPPAQAKGKDKKGDPGFVSFQPSFQSPNWNPE